jgi:hypothetical protein
MASEVLIKFSWVGFKVSEVPITLTKRKFGKSHKGLFRYGKGVIATIIRSWLDIRKNHYKSLSPKNRHE